MTYQLLSYADNWSFWNSPYPTCTPPAVPQQYATIPSGVEGITAFAVINDDGTFDARYPVKVINSTFIQGINPAATYGLAIGGWTNSNLYPGANFNMGLMNVLTNQQGSSTYLGYTAPQKMLMNYLYVAGLPLGTTWEDSDLPWPASGDPVLTPLIPAGLGFQNITIDYEGFGTGTPLIPSTVSNWITNTSVDPSVGGFYQQMQRKLPNVALHLAIPGLLSNVNNYMNFDSIYKDAPNLKFQLMLYDYAAGLGAQPIVTANASLADSWDALTQYFAGTTVYSVDRFYFGFPTYGRGYFVAPGLDPNTLAQNIASGTYRAMSYANNNTTLKGGAVPNIPQQANTPSGVTAKFAEDGLISNDDILSLINDWDSPATGWTLIQVPRTTKVNQRGFTDYYYYQTNPQGSNHAILITAFPNGNTFSTVRDMATMVKNFEGEYGDGKQFAGFMNWEAQLDYCGLAMTKLKTYLGQ